MHVIEHIIMAEKEAQQQQQKAANAATTATKTTDPKRLQAMEAKAVAEATATADASYIPSASLLNAPTAAPLLKQVDGPSLQSYEGKESVYVGRSVPVAAGGTLKVPIQVSAPGSVVEYAVENKTHDFAFGITAEREEGITIVKEVERVDASKTAITGKFLVGSVPCLIQFSFENDYSWYREKVVSYRVTVTPPSLDTLKAGRRRRARACLKAVAEDVKSANKRYSSATEQKVAMEKELDALYAQIEQKKKALAVVKKEEAWLKERVALREAQTKALQQRLDEGWADEKEDKKQ